MDFYLRHVESTSEDTNSNTQSNKYDKTPTREPSSPQWTASTTSAAHPIHTCPLLALSWNLSKVFVIGIVSSMRRQLQI
jgi:hypothetical protein